MMNRRMPALFILAMIALLSAGCKTGPQPTEITAASPGTGSAPTDLVLSAEAGIEVARPAGAPGVQDLARTMSFGSRLNPFGLLAREAKFNQEQVAERIISEAGGWSVSFELPDETPVEQEVRLEPTPIWRVSGILIGETVVALLDTGTATYDLRPGMRVPGTEWTVISIDEERIVLQRDGAALPKQFSVPLAGPLGGSALAPSGPTGGFGGPAGPAGPRGRGGDSADDKG